MSAGQQERWWGCCACVWTGTWTLLSHPTPPHPTTPETDHERAVPVSAGQQERWWDCCASVWTGTWTLLSHPTPPHPTPLITNDERAVPPVCAQEPERYCPTPPHPTPPVSDHERAVPVSAGQQGRWWGCCACVCTGTWTLLSHPTPPHLKLIIKKQCLCRQDNKKDDEVAVPVCGQEHERYCGTPPHPTGKWSWNSVSDHERAVPVFAGQQERWWGCCACMCTGTWTFLWHSTPLHR